jgi:hypothetical protein
MKATWKRIHMIRDLHAAPEYLVITVWGRQFRVELAPVLERAARLDTDVTVEIVGPTIGSREASTLRVFRVDETDRQEYRSSGLEPPGRPALQLVADDAVSLQSDEEDTLVKTSSPATPEKGGRRG